MDTVSAEPAAREPKPTAGNPKAAANKQQPPAQTVLRLRFSRHGPATWLAHLDLMRTIERAVKRANLPVHWSSGFNPRPDLVFALPIGVGLETCADYVDIGLARDPAPGPTGAAPGPTGAAPARNGAEPEQHVAVSEGSGQQAAPSEAAAVSETAAYTAQDAEAYMARLSAALPEGLALVSGRLQPAEKESIMGRIAYADYQIEAAGLADAAGRAMAQETLVIDKPSKGRILKLDIRPLILQIAVDAPDRLRLRVRAGSRENLRPDLFLLALAEYGGLDRTASADARLVRTGLYLAGAAEGQMAADPEGNPMPDEPAGCA